MGTLAEQGEGVVEPVGEIRRRLPRKAATRASAGRRSELTERLILPNLEENRKCENSELTKGKILPTLEQNRESETAELSVIRQNENVDKIIEKKSKYW